MFSKSRNLFLVAALLVPTIAHSQNSKQLKKDHTFLVSSLKNLSVEFTLEIYSAFRKRTRHRSGKALFARPNSFRWTFDDKYGFEEYFFNGSKLSHFKKSENLVVNYNINKGFAKELHQLVEMVLNPDKLLDRYSYKKTTEYHITLTPKGPQASDVKEISISLQPPNKRFVASIGIYYQDENKSTYRFTKQQSKKKISKKSFVFANPGGVKVKTLK